MKTLLVLIPLVIFSNSNSQPSATDPDRSDTTTVNTFLEKSASVEGADSAAYWAEKALALSRKIGWQAGKVKALEQQGNVFVSTSNYARALEYFLLALRENEKSGINRETVNLYRKIARIHSRQGDFPTGLSYARKTVSLLRQLGDDERSAYFMIGSAFDNMKIQDSALYYYQRAYEYSSTSPDKRILAGILSHLGVLHAKMNNIPLALTYARMAVNAYEAYNSKQGGSAYRHLADIFRDLGMRDSAYYYAEKNYRHGEVLGDKEMKLEGAELLAETASDEKTAVKYYRIARVLRDSLYSAEKTADIKSLEFNERQRQHELERARQQEAADRRLNIQYAAIAVGLIAFLVFYLILSHSIVAREKPVRFLGALSLLLVFEFINLVIHPWVSHITHHSPLLMLLVMVVIASTLIPLHHRLEKWAIHRLVERNKRIRLTAAKKTIAKLEGTPVDQN